MVFNLSPFFRNSIDTFPLTLDTFYIQVVITSVLVENLEYMRPKSPNHYPLGSPFYAPTLDACLERDKLIKMKLSLVS
jgi:hypothetical protein